MVSELADLKHMCVALHCSTLAAAKLSVYSVIHTATYEAWNNLVGSDPSYATETVPIHVWYANLYVYDYLLRCPTPIMERHRVGKRQ